MNILAIDTSMQACSAAVLADGRLSRLFEARASGHAEAIVPMIEAVMERARIGFAALDRIAVTTGPGSFTGVRIGVATARGLSLAAKVPLVGRSTLAVMARQLLGHGDVPETSHIAIAADARRGQVYWALFEPGGRLASQPAAGAPGDVVAGLPEGPVTIAGTGAIMVAEAGRGMRREIAVARPDLQPDAGTLAEWGAGLALGREPVTPLYLRPPDAKPQSDKALPWRA